ncbi:transposase zinc-binding domain-containing protein [Colwellia sp. M166]|uniref:IS91 family transposase n=1 Tax=Colwellia sp. M166 TaxID=2583805 RepID=UPI00211EF7BC|nr:transposase zinc-binding domain-containing protein [Colwellia sp. M166]
MIELAQIARQYQDEFTQKYAKQMKGVHHQALTKIMACHTPQAGAMLYHCDDCQTNSTFHPSCGHRHCPACQHKSNSDWLTLQQQKLLPVDYYLVTFTLPYQCRHFIWTHQKWAYQAMFTAAKQTLDAFFLNEINSLGKIMASLRCCTRTPGDLSFTLTFILWYPQAG